MHSHNLDVIAALLVSLSVVSVLAFLSERRANRKAKAHPLAPVVPLRTGHVRVVPGKGKDGAA